jgi:hypothetical protein
MSHLSLVRKMAAMEYGTFKILSVLNEVTIRRNFLCVLPKNRLTSEKNHSHL